jgi:hemoglobin
MSDALEHEPRFIRGQHPLISADDISRLVDDFYADIRVHPDLGPIFNPRLEGKWPEHLTKLKAFWRSVLLTTGEYNGRPVPAHNNISELESRNFAEWLNLFDQHIERIFEPQAQAIIKQKARRIARSLWFARFGTPFNNPPEW